MVMPFTQSKIVEKAWLIVFLLMPVALLNYLDRQMMASMQSSVMASIPELGQAENREELWGFMLGQFKWVYAVFSLIGGFIADRLSRRYTICASLFVWSTVTWWTGQVTTYNELLWTRSLMGISEAFYIPAALALITDYHTQGTRSRAIGFHQIAIYLGVIAGGFGGYLADAPNFGWRWAFSACGILGVIYSLPLIFLLPKDVRKRQHHEETRLPVFRSFKELILNPSFVLLVFYFTLPAMAAWVVRDWMPAIIKKQFQVNQGQAGVAATLYWQVAAIVGAIIGGWAADYRMRFHDKGRITVSALGVSLIVVSILGVGYSSVLTNAIFFLVIFGIGWGLFDCNNMPILTQIVRPELRATGYGVMNFVSISFGGLADWGFGRLQDSKVPLSIIFTGFAGVAVFSIVLVLLIRPTKSER
jgi:MFS transporter, Spinster family, sphingosine-1-phosphate transporter